MYESNIQLSTLKKEANNQLTSIHIQQYLSKYALFIYSLKGMHTIKIETILVK